MGDSHSLLDLFEDAEFGHDGCWGASSSPEILLSILQSLENAEEAELTPLEEAVFSPRGSSSTTGAASAAPAGGAAGVVTTSPGCTLHEDEGDLEASAPRKRMKTAEGAFVESSGEAAAAAAFDGPHRMSHITVERNRRKQMNDHLSVLRSLMPCFYVKRGDQASIIGGVVDYIKELQQVLQSLEAKKQRKVYSEVLSPRPSPLSPRPPPLSPRINLPISPRTPQPGSPYKPRVVQQPYLSPALSSSLDPSPTLDGGASTDLAANSKSPVADVEVKFSGPNLLLKTISPRIPGQALKIVAVLEGLALEILQVNINTVDDRMLNSFTIKIGIECELSAEELANEVQQTFS